MFPDGSAGNNPNVTNASGSYPIGTSLIYFHYREFNGALSTYATITLNVVEYPNPITALACNDNVQVSLDQNCTATIDPDMILEGGPYGCYGRYRVVVHGNGHGSAGIDRDPASPGVQLDMNDFGNCYITSVFDTVTGNSCWGEICIEDKLDPVLTCPRDISIPCGESAHPDITGWPTVDEACGLESLTWTDVVEDLGCEFQLESRITRTWKATDKAGNMSTCDQIITVLLGNVASVVLPPHYNDIDEPSLSCDEKYDPDFDPTPHIFKLSILC